MAKDESDLKPTPEEKIAIGRFLLRILTSYLFWLSSIALLAITGSVYAFWGSLVGNGECLVVSKQFTNESYGTGSAFPVDTLIIVEARNTGFVTLHGAHLVLSFTDTTADSRLKDAKPNTEPPPGVTVVRWISDSKVEWVHHQGEPVSIATIKPNGPFPIGATFGAMIRINRPVSGDPSTLDVKKTRLQTDGHSFAAEEIGDSLSWNLSHCANWLTRIMLCSGIVATLILLACVVHAIYSATLEVRHLTAGVKDASDAISTNLSDATGKMLNKTTPENVGAMINAMKGTYLLPPQAKDAPPPSTE